MNVHLYPSDFRNESRIEKQANFINDIIKDEQIFLLGAGKGTFAISNNINVVLLGRNNTKRGILNKFITFFLYYYKVVMFLNEKPVKMINAHSLSVLPLGYILKIIHNSKLIYDTHELETETIGSHGVRKKIGKFVERLFIEKSDHVFVVSNSIADWYKNKYGIERPTVVLNTPRYRELVKRDHFREELGIRKEQKIVLYQGGLSQARGVKLLLDAFQERQDDHAVIVFMGYGELEAEVRKLADRHTNIFHFPPVSPDVVLEFTASADAGIHVIQNTCLNHFYCMPNKLLEYAMAGLPVVVSNMKDMSQFVAQHNMGAVVKELSPAFINQAIDELLAGDLLKMSKNAYKAATDNAWEVQEKRMLAAYKKICSSWLDPK